LAAKLIESTLILGIAVLRSVDDAGQLLDRIDFVRRPRLHAVRPRPASV
jgi:hypothetical protein